MNIEKINTKNEIEKLRSELLQLDTMCLEKSQLQSEIILIKSDLMQKNTQIEKFQRGSNNADLDKKVFL